MGKCDLDRIRHLATQFRHACEEYTAYPFCYFPEGLCGCTSEMLECYLAENGVPSLTHVWGENPDSEETHAWTRIRDDLIIDITLDQFSKSFPPVYIGKPLAIHKEFSILEESESNSDIDDNLELAIHYSSILRIVKSHIAPPTPY